MIGINKVIRTIIISDFALQSGWGLIGPIFAIFITRHIEGGSLAAVGLVAATYWVSKSIAQVFIGRFLDVQKGEKDDFKFLVGGMLVVNLVPLGYFFSANIWHIFLLEFIRGLAMACVVPAWAAIFTRHIDKGWEAFSWSIDSTAIGLSFGFAAAFGGIIASILGFKAIFILATAFGLLALLILLLIRNQLFLRDRLSPEIPPKERPL